MKILQAVVPALALVASLSINANASIVAPYENRLDSLFVKNGIQLAGFVNPYWGSGTGFHWVQPRAGSGYWRSNPDGQCWNNKYGC